MPIPTFSYTDFHRGPLQKDIVILELDRFLYKQLQQKPKYFDEIEIRVIVGKGSRSKNMIDGTNPFRAWVTEYLNSAGYKYREENDFLGSSGSLMVLI